MRLLLRGLLLAYLLLSAASANAGTKTWDGRYDTSRIDLTLVYFVPSDRTPLPDWRDRVDYFAHRVEQFHHREFGTQSRLVATVHPTPIVSKRTTAELRQGDANRIYYRTLEEVDQLLEFGRREDGGFPILLVLSEINWRPLDDFYRLQPRDGTLVFEGNVSGGQHFPGAASGGARASYRPDRGVGWGLVSADGWRVPYRGSDCVVYHEGCGHTVGLPHPEPGNGSVMSLGQYRGWLSESWLDREQKLRLGWTPEPPPSDPQTELFSGFRALPEPTVPQPGQPVALRFDWPDGARLATLRVRYQTAVGGPWVEVAAPASGPVPESLTLAAFDRPTPVSYRIDVELEGGATTESWGYFQVRAEPDRVPLPLELSPDLVPLRAGEPNVDAVSPLASNEVDLLARIDPAKVWAVGDWTKEEGTLVSPKQFGARLQVPYTPPAEYRLVAIVEPLDEPNALVLGQRTESGRFLTLFGFRVAERRLSAIENVDGRNVGNDTTFVGDLFRVGQPSQVIVTVTRRGVSMSVDGRVIVDYRGSAERLSLSDYWNTPDDRSLFVGSYDCRYRIHRLTLEPRTAKGHELPDPAVE